LGERVDLIVVGSRWEYCGFFDEPLHPLRGARAVIAATIVARARKKDVARLDLGRDGVRARDLVAVRRVGNETLESAIEIVDERMTVSGCLDENAMAAVSREMLVDPVGLGNDRVARLGIRGLTAELAQEVMRIDGDDPAGLPALLRDAFACADAGLRDALALKPCDVLADVGMVGKIRGRLGEVGVADRAGSQEFSVGLEANT
jgi:hypothetical protein